VAFPRYINNLAITENHRQNSRKPALSDSSSSTRKGVEDQASHPHQLNPQAAEIQEALSKSFSFVCVRSVCEFSAVRTLGARISVSNTMTHLRS
jgi:hypothetical protein